MAIDDWLTDDTSDIGTEYVRSTRPPAATYGQTFSLSDQALALLLYQQGAWTQYQGDGGGAASGAGGAGVDLNIIPEVVVEARRPPEDDPPPPPPIREDQIDEAPPDEGFLAPVVIPEIVVRTTRPSPIAPRPPPAPRPVRGGPLAILGIVVPWFMKVLGDVDAYGTQHALERITRPPRRNPPRTALPDLPPDRFRYGRPRPWGISGPPLPDVDGRPDEDARTVRSPAAPRAMPPAPDELGMPEITVTGRAPRVLPNPAWWDFPFVQPGVEGDPLPAAIPQEFDRPGPTPEVVDDPARSPFPADDLGPRPIGDPVPDPVAPRLPRPDVRPPTIDPGFGGLPTFGVGPQPALPPPGTPTNVDTCACPKPKKKSNKKKDRSICYGGTFLERSKSLLKRRRYRVDCKTGKRLDDPDLGNPGAPKKPKPRPKKKPGYPVPPSWEVPQ